MHSRLIPLIALVLAATPLAAQKTQTIKLIHKEGTSLYRFEPNTVTVSAGDILVFTLESGGPYMVAFEPTDFRGPAKALMAGAIPGSNPELRAPAMSKKGDSIRITVPSLPAGQYRFYSVTHVAYRMTGSMTVR